MATATVIERIECGGLLAFNVLRPAGLTPLSKHGLTGVGTQPNVR